MSRVTWLEISFPKSGKIEEIVLGSCHYTVSQKYEHTGLKQNLLRSITLDVITRVLDNAAFVCIHVVERFSKDSQKCAD